MGHKEDMTALMAKMAQDVADEIDAEIVRDIGESFFLPGQIHMTRNVPRMVRLIRKIPTPLSQRGPWWKVEDVRYGYEFSCSQTNLGVDTFNGMEVIAWTTQN